MYTPLFTQHSRSWRDNRYVYPVVSRRSKGLSVGVNLNPDKICNFDCIYCCVDRREMPGRVEVDPAALRVEIEHMVELVRSGEIWRHPPFDATPEPLRRFNDIAFSGDGEPTSYAGFGDACALAAETLARAGLPDVKVVVITNATLFHQPRVAAALRFLDAHHGEIWAKLDAGTEAYYRLVERTTIPLARVLENIRDAGRLRPLVIQALFMRVHGNGPDDAEQQAFVDRLRDLRQAGCAIKLVQVYTVARGTAEAYVAPLPREEVDALAARVAAAGFVAEAYYGPE